MQFVDTHIHLPFEPLYTDFQNIVKNLNKYNISKFIIPSTREQDWSKIEIINNFLSSNANFAIGIHPLYCEEYNDLMNLKIRSILEQNPKFLIGEIGLDKIYDFIPFETQLTNFNHQIKIAIHYLRPVILHVRKAHQETLQILKRDNFTHGGIVHSFSGSYEEALEFLKLNFVIGIGPNILKNNANRIIKIVKQIPIDQLVIETDAPDQSQPEQLLEIFEQLVKIKDLDKKEAANHLLTTSLKFF